MSEFERMQGQIDVLMLVCAELMFTRLDKKPLYKALSEKWEENAADKSDDYRAGADEVLRSVFRGLGEPPAEKSAVE